MTPLTDQQQGAAKYFDVIGKAATLGADATPNVTAGGKTVPPARKDVDAPVTKIVNALKKDGKIVLTKKVVDASRIDRTVWRLGTGPIKIWAGKTLKVAPSKSKKLSFASVDVYDNEEKAKKVPGAIVRRFT